MAEQSELNFYEAGRFYYGAARLIYTLEAFRQKQRVVSRITEKVYLDARIRAPAEGSFIQDIIIAAAPAISECAVKVPLDALFSQIWSLLLPSGRSKQEALDIGRTYVEHAQVGADNISEIRRIVESGNATTQQAPSILQEVVRSRDQNVVRRMPFSPEELTSRGDDLRAELEREKIRLQYTSELSKITLEQERRLSSQVRKSVQEVLIPLRSSARGLDVYIPANDNPIAVLDENTAKIIGDESIDDDPTVLIVKIKRFDRETGFGLARYDDLKVPVTFRIGQNDAQSRDEVIAAMREDEVSGSFYIVRDSYGTPKLLILDRLVEFGE